MKHVTPKLDINQPGLFVFPDKDNRVFVIRENNPNIREKYDIFVVNDFGGRNNYLYMISVLNYVTACAFIERNLSRKADADA